MHYCKVWATRACANKLVHRNKTSLLSRDLRAMGHCISMHLCVRLIKHFFTYYTTFNNQLCCKKRSIHNCKTSPIRTCADKLVHDTDLTVLWILEVGTCLNSRLMPAYLSFWITTTAWLGCEFADQAWVRIFSGFSLATKDRHFLTYNSSLQTNVSGQKATRCITNSA
jgi:hypothetical protein